MTETFTQCLSSQVLFALVTQLRLQMNFHLASEAAQHVGKSAYLFRKLHAKWETQQYTPALENAILAWFLFPYLWNGDKETSKPCTGLQNWIERGGLRLAVGLCGGRGGGHLVSTLQSLILHDPSPGTNWLGLLVCFRRPQFANIFTQIRKLQPLFQGIQPIHRQLYPDSFTRGKYLKHSPF